MGHISCHSFASMAKRAGPLAGAGMLLWLLVLSVRDLAGHPFVGVDPSDPYGAILARPFADAGLPLHHTMRGRFAQTVISLVRHGLGVAVIDEVSVAEIYMPGIVRRGAVSGNLPAPRRL